MVPFMVTEGTRSPHGPCSAPCGFGRLIDPLVSKLPLSSTVAGSSDTDEPLPEASLVPAVPLSWPSGETLKLPLAVTEVSLPSETVISPLTLNPSGRGLTVPTLGAPGRPRKPPPPAATPPWSLTPPCRLSPYPRPSGMSTLPPANGLVERFSKNASPRPLSSVTIGLPNWSFGSSLTSGGSREPCCCCAGACCAPAGAVIATAQTTAAPSTTVGTALSSQAPRSPAPFHSLVDCTHKPSLRAVPGAHAVPRRAGRSAYGSRSPCLRRWW